MPCLEIIPISLISFDSVLIFTAICSDKYKGDILASCRRRRRLQIGIART